MGLIVELVERSGLPEVRDAALVAWSRFASPASILDRLQRGLAGPSPGAPILAAGNVLSRAAAAKGHTDHPGDDAARADLRRALMDRVLDPRAPLSRRSDALTAVLPALDDETIDRLRQAGLPAVLADRIRDGW